MKGGWRLTTIITIALLIQYIRNPPTGCGVKMLLEVVKPHIGHHPMHWEL